MEKLPEWPERPVLKQPVTQLDVASAWHMFEHKRAEAALARMEALVEVVTLWRKRMRHSMDDDDLAAVDALLASCERGKEAGR